jgi:hypothetical protein
MKTITASPGSGEVSEKTASAIRGDDFSGLTEGQGLRRGCGQVDVTAGRKNVLACTQVDVYFRLPEGQNVNPAKRQGLRYCVDTDLDHH